MKRAEALTLRRSLARRAAKGRPPRDAGVALIAVVVMIAIIAATAAELAHNARVDYSSAINARDDLRAHYLSRSSIELSRLLLKIQERWIDANSQLFGAFDLQIADYAPLLITAFQSREGAEALGGLLGVAAGDIKGLGIDVGELDLEIESLDGRININCGGGANPAAPAVSRLAASLAALMLPRRYDRLFEDLAADGQHYDRLAVLRAIIDWADQDQQMFGGSAAEDYRYNQGKDGYEAKNQYYDTLEELRLVRGVDDAFMAAFADQLTVYGSCKVNANLADVPTIMALIMQYAAQPGDPGLEIRNLALLARYVHQIGRLRGGFGSVKDFTDAVQDPMAQLALATALDNLAAEGQGGQPAGLPPVVGVQLSSEIGEAILGRQPRRIWRIVGKATVGRVKKRITAVWDQALISMQAARAGQGAGGFVYWREE